MRFKFLNSQAVETGLKIVHTIFYTIKKGSFTKHWDFFQSKYLVSLFLSPSVCCPGTGNDWEVWLHHGIQHRVHLHSWDLPHRAEECWHGNVLISCTHWQYHSSLRHLFGYVDHTDMAYTLCSIDFHIKPVQDDTSDIHRYGNVSIFK